MNYNIRFRQLNCLIFIEGGIIMEKEEFYKQFESALKFRKDYETILK